VDLPGRPPRRLLSFTSTGHLEPTVLILVLAELFGLATDYEVFLLSRVREQWDATGDNTTAVATGLQRTGRIITAAAARYLTDCSTGPGRTGDGVSAR
jgi:trehalose monomycolate/heme transporter